MSSSERVLGALLRPLSFIWHRTIALAPISEAAYPSASGGSISSSSMGELMIEQMPNINAPRGCHARFPALSDRIPAPLPGRGGLRRVPVRGALARWLRLPGLWQDQGVGTANQAVDLRVRRLRQADLGDRRHHHAPLQTAADDLVLGGLPDGHPFQRHLRPATAAPARPGLV